MDSVENNINLLISELKRSNLGKDQSLDYLGHVFRTITKNNVDDRKSAALTVNDYLKKARGGDFRYASGFFGNWAKHSEENIESFDVNDTGC